MVSHKNGQDHDRIQSFKGVEQRFPSDCSRDVFLGRYGHFDLWWAMPELHVPGSGVRPAPNPYILASATSDGGINVTGYTDDDCQRLDTQSIISSKEAAAVACWTRATTLCSKHRMEISLSFQEAKAYG